MNPLADATGFVAVEHDTLRPSYRDARIHAAVNCASVSCPDMCAPFHRTRLLLSPPRL